MIM
jgi:hypothetical protein